jgi:hypothetical protein
MSKRFSQLCIRLGLIYERRVYYGFFNKLLGGLGFNDYHIYVTNSLALLRYEGSCPAQCTKD